MTARYLGLLTVGGILPGVQVIATAGIAGIQASLPELTSRLRGLLTFSPTPTSFGAQIAQLQAMIASLQQMLTLGVQPPSVAIQLGNIANLITALQGSITLLTQSLGLITEFQQLLTAAGVHLIQYTGRADQLGSEVSGVLSGVPGVNPGDSMNALVIATSIPNVWTSISRIFRVSA